MQSNKSFVKAYARKLPLRLLLLLALFAGALFVFAYVAHEVLAEREENVDNDVFSFLSAHVISDGLTGFMKVITFFASATFLQIAYGCVFLFYLVGKNTKRVFEIAVIGLGGFLVNYFMKLAFHRPRPPHPLVAPLQNFSFPSGHATSGFIFYGLIAYLVWKSELSKAWRYVLAFFLVSFSLLIGFSRVYLRVHYPSDVLAGFCVGFAWLLLTIAVMEQLKKRTGREQRGNLRPPRSREG